jgi:hypothetical protein
MENTLPCIREEEFHSITKKINEFLKKKEYDKAIMNKNLNQFFYKKYVFSLYR